MGWIFGGGLAGLLMAALIYLADTPDFLDEAPLSGVALVVLGLQVGALIQRRGASRKLIVVSGESSVSRHESQGARQGE